MFLKRIFVPKMEAENACSIDLAHAVAGASLKKSSPRPRPAQALCRLEILFHSFRDPFSVRHPFRALSHARVRAGTATDFLILIYYIK